MASSPHVEVLAVCHLPITEEWFSETFEYAYGTGEGEEPTEHERVKAYFRNLLERVVLVEVRVVNRTSEFSVERFTQLEPSPSTVPRQAPYLEHYLNEDGSELAPGTDRYLPAPPEGDLRMVFFMHYWNGNAPLETPFGPVTCPRPAPMPDRLATLVSYEPVD